MQNEIDRMVADFERGRLSRRQLIAHLTGMAALGVGAGGANVFGAQQPQDSASKPADAGGATGSAPIAATFQAVDLNHIALSVSDVQRSQDWYMKHLGLKQMGQRGFLTTGRGWLAMFRGEKPGLHHYCFSIDDYDPDDAARRLEAAGLTARRRGGRIYFDDPDGIECQLARTIVP